MHYHHTVKVTSRPGADTPRQPTGTNRRCPDVLTARQHEQRLLAEERRIQGNIELLKAHGVDPNSDGSLAKLIELGGKL